MGEVYRARDPRLGRYVAIKVLPPAFSSDPDRLRRFEQEARAAAALNHPSIVAIFDIGTTEDGAPYIVSELLEGFTLGHYIRTARLPLPTVIEYGLQIARGLAAAHEKGIIHRDLKPENIFVTRDGHIKILDFGLAKLMDPPRANPGDKTISVPDGGSLPGVVLGTVGYMAPEQIRGQPADARSDIFSFGLILYEMIAGRPAFRAATTADTQAAVLKEEPQHLSATNATVPPGLEQIVGHCLEKEPQRRFQATSDIAFSLQSLTAPSQVPSGLGRSVGPTPFRNWKVIALAAVVAAALVAGAMRIGQKMGRATPPEYQQLTYQPGVITSARISPDGQTLLCAARFSHAFQLYSIRFDSIGVRPLGVDADQILASSSKGDVAILESQRSLTGSTGVGLMARLPLGGGAPKMVMKDVQSADWAPDGSELAIAHYIPEKRVYRLEYPVGRVLYETAGWIGDVRFSADGNTIAFVDHPVFGDDGGYVAVTAASGGAVRHLTRLWGDMRGLAWHPGGEVWYTATDVGFNSALYAATQSGKSRSVLTVPGGLVLNDIARDGRVLVTYTNERTVIMVSTHGQPEEQNLAWLDNTEFFRFSADGTQILLGDQSSASGIRHASFLRNVDGSSAVRVGDGDGIAVSPDGEWVLSHIPPNQLVLLPIGAGEIRRVESGTGDDPPGANSSKPSIRADLPADWCPDGKRIAFVGDDNRTHLVDLDGNDTALTPVGTIGHLITADGKFVLVETRAGTHELYPIGGGDAKPFPFLQPTDRPVRFSSDGKDLFVRSSRAGSAGVDLYRVNVTTGARALLWHLQSPRTTVANEVAQVDVTPDGTGYAYGYRQKSTVLYAVTGLK
jgi:eukaryotic-like serine/threonine-protein kinase